MRKDVIQQRFRRKNTVDDENSENGNNNSFNTSNGSINKVKNGGLISEKNASLEQLATSLNSSILPQLSQLAFMGETPASVGTIFPGLVDEPQAAQLG